MVRSQLVGIVGSSRFAAQYRLVVNQFDWAGAMSGACKLQAGEVILVVHGCQICLAYLSFGYMGNTFRAT